MLLYSLCVHTGGYTTSFGKWIIARTHTKPHTNLLIAPACICTLCITSSNVRCNNVKLNCFKLYRYMLFESRQNSIWYMFCEWDLLLLLSSTPERPLLVCLSRPTINKGAVHKQSKLEFAVLHRFQILYMLLRMSQQRRTIT